MHRPIQAVGGCHTQPLRGTVYEQFQAVQTLERCYHEAMGYRNSGATPVPTHVPIVVETDASVPFAAPPDGGGASAGAGASGGSGPKVEGHDASGDVDMAPARVMLTVDEAGGAAACTCPSCGDTFSVAVVPTPAAAAALGFAALHDGRRFVAVGRVVGSHLEDVVSHLPPESYAPGHVPLLLSAKRAHSALRSIVAELVLSDGYELSHANMLCVKLTCFTREQLLDLHDDMQYVSGSSVPRLMSG